jgi:hypothetical protein
MSSIPENASRETRTYKGSRVLIERPNSRYKEKTLIELKLSNYVLNNHEQIDREIGTILTDSDGYEYNTKLKKLRKHFPLSESTTISYEDVLNNPKKYHSCSFSRKPFPEQKMDIRGIATQRKNLTYMLVHTNPNEMAMWIEIKHRYFDMDIMSAVDLRYNLQKHTGDEIRRNFPHFYDETKKRLYYDTVYIIKTTDPFKYINVKDFTFCDSVLICCTGKTYNIMFDLDKRNPVYGSLLNVKCDMMHIQKLMESQLT